MIQRVYHSPCLGDRIGSLADGAMPGDAATRAIAHVTVCQTCRDALELERLTIERLRSLPSPVPSGDLMVALLALGEPGGPVPQRRGRVPGTLRQPTAAVAAPGAYPSGWPGTTSPSGSRRPGGRRPTVSRRAFVTAAAGALGAGALAVSVIGGTAALSPLRPPVRPPVDHLTVDQPVVDRPGATRGSTSQVVAHQFAVDHRYSGRPAVQVFLTPSGAGLRPAETPLRSATASGLSRQTANVPVALFQPSAAR